MALSPDVSSILKQIESLSSIPVEVHADSTLRRPGRVLIARGERRSHLCTYNPNLQTADYYVAFEAAFILRLFETPADGRVQFAETGEGLREIEKLESAMLSKFPPAGRKQFQQQVHDGLLSQLRSQPVGMRINEWLREAHPGLAEVQRQGIEMEQREAVQVLAPDLRSITPRNVYEASTAMNAAVALWADRLLGISRYAVPYEAAGLAERGRDLLAIADSIPAAPARDRERVDRWGEKLGLSTWFQWVPLS